MLIHERVAEGYSVEGLPVNYKRRIDEESLMGSCRGERKEGRGETA